MAVSFVVLYSFYTLRSVARESRDYALGYVRQGGKLPGTLGSKSRDIKALENMHFWPYGYGTLNSLLLLCIFGIAGLFYYPIFVVALGYVMGLVLYRSYRRLKDLTPK
jgi:hypothetical protein